VKMNSNVKDVGHLLNELIDTLGLTKRVHEQRAMIEFETIMGADFCKRAEPVRIEQGVLFLKVTHSVWRQELFYQKELIKNRINDYLKEEIIQDIIFR
jgi:hypothetical protein